MADEAPRLAYWHLWADDDGISHHTQCHLSQFESARLGPGDAPQWNDRVLRTGNAFLTVLPVGWTAGWHINETAKWIFVLTGAWYVESMDGQRVEIGAGEFSFGGDQDCKADSAGRIGHLSGQVGDVPCVQLIVQNNDPAAWAGARPGAFE
ncbi:MAG: cupin domain-containing protein [Bauldia sp.]|nr:cupin domain-containing protein [Bauldia sp.]